MKALLHGGVALVKVEVWHVALRWRCDGSGEKITVMFVLLACVITGLYE